MADYRPDPTGGWLAAVRPAALLLLPAAHADDLADLWPVLATTDPAPAVIDRVTTGGVTSAPGFALVVRESEPDSVRVLVRGPLTVGVGGETVSGAGVSTWSERVFAGAASSIVSVVGASGATDAAGRRLPIVEGVVAASVIDWDGTERRREPVVVPAAGRSPEESPGGPTEERPSALPQTSLDERTMVPAEDTVVGFSRTERPRFDDTAATRAPGRDSPPEAPSATTIVPPPGYAAADMLGDHDGLTVAAADITGLRARREGGAAAAGRGADRPGSEDRLALRMPDGSFEPVAGELLLGRAPVIGRVVGSRVPRPVVIGAGDPDISRTHLRVAVEGGTAVVTDLESRNGTHVVAPGQAPMRLRPSEPTPVLPETVIDLGGGWTVQVVMR